MARTPFNVEVLTPEGQVFEGEVEMVSTRTSVGSIGILAHHQPLLGMLDAAELRLYTGEDDVVRYAQGEGYVQVGEDGVLILVEEALRPEELDVADLQAKLDAAQADLDGAESGSEQARVATTAVRRWAAFLAIARGDTPS